jgi:hypothetical protein
LLVLADVHTSMWGLSLALEVMRRSRSSEMLVSWANHQFKKGERHAFLLNRTVHAACAQCVYG